MWRIAEIIGDGRIDGWQVVESSFPNIIVKAGSGIIDGYFVNTFDDQLFELSENGIFYVYAQRRVGITGSEGPKSEVKSIGYTDSGPPSVLTGLTASTFNPFSVFLSWNNNTEADLDHYDIERSVDDSVYVLISQSDENSYEDQTVDEDTQYYYKVYAVDQSGNRSSPDSVSVSTGLSSSSPSNPIDVLMIQSEYGVNVLWKRPVTVPFSKISNYLLTYVEVSSDDSEIESTQQIISINKNLYFERINDLTVGQRYKLTLQVVDSKGRISSGITKFVTPQPSPAPPDPSGISWTFQESPGGIQINLSWEEGDSPYDDSSSYRFKIYITPENGRESVGINVPIGLKQEQVSLYTYDLVNYISIAEGELVSIRITAINEAGHESFGSWVRFRTDILTAPRRLRNITSDFIPESRRISIKWENWPETYDIRVEVSYDNQTDEYIGNTALIDERIIGANLYTIENVDLDTIYTISLTPYNIDNSAGTKTTFTESTVVPDLPLPSPPLNLEVMSSDSQLTLKWDRSTTAYSKSYMIYRKLGGVTVAANDWTLIDETPSSITNFVDFGLINGEEYSYYIITEDVYGRKSLHLPDGAVNMNFVQGVPRQEGILTQPTDVSLNLLPSNEVLITWSSLEEEFDSFSIYRSIGNLHSWTLVADVPKDTFSYTDITLPLVDGTTFYYVVSKTFNDSDLIVQSTLSAPENSLLLAKVTTSGSGYEIDISGRRDIKDLADPLAEYTKSYLLPHRHREILDFDPSRIDLNSELSITDWTTVDGRIWFTNEDDISGTSYIVKVNERVPQVYYSVDSVNRRLIFSEPIASLDEFGEFVGDPPTIEVRVLGIEEVQNVLSDKSIEDLHARQVIYGEIKKEQIKKINHEGRIKERMLPKRFYLERLSNNQFIVPQSSPDSSKTFGDGTTFFVTTESDGQIEFLFDFDLQDDGAIVGFQKPDYADDTIFNLKQNSISSTLSTQNDVANDYIFNKDYLWASSSTKSFLLNKNTLLSTETNTHGLVDVADITIDKDSQIAYLANSGPNYCDFYKVDLPTGEVSLIGSLSDLTAQELVTAFEYNTDDRKFYIVITNISFDPAVMKLCTVNMNTFAVSLVNGINGLTGSGEISGMTYDQDSRTMWVVTNESLSNSKIGSINLSTGQVSYISTSIFNSRSIAYDHDESFGTHRLVANEFTDIYKFRTTDINQISIGSTTLSAEAFSFPPSDLSFYMTAEDSIPGSDRIRFGDFVGLTTTTYLRFAVNVWPESEVSKAQIVFTAHQTEESSGNNVQLKISMLDPTGFSESVDLSFDVVKSIPTIGNIIWSPQDWSYGEQSESTSVNVTSLIQQYVDSDYYVQGNHIIFKIETVDTTTSGHHRTAETYGDNQPKLEIDYTVSRSEVDSETGGYQSNKSYRFSFEFEDSNPTRWVRITTNNSAIKPNPIIDLGKRIRFRILNSQASIYLAFGIRETGDSEATVGDDGGTTGPIEWVNVSDVITDDNGNIAPLGTLVKASNEWQEIDVDLTRSGIRSYSNGNGVLEKRFGVLEHIAFTINPEDPNATGPFEIYIDEIQQVSDLLVSGTSQGILLSRDFGVSWTLSRLTSTPVHKFYKSTNGFLWAISANEVLFSKDPAYWFVVGGTTGVQYIKDIVEDAERDMYISTDKGVYWLDVTLLNRFAQFRQTQPINAFSTDSYGLYAYKPSSGINEIWASTELGIYKTTDKGESWIETVLDTSGLVIFKFITIDNDIIVGCTRKHIIRKTTSDSVFKIIADFEEQHNIFDIWSIEWFAKKLYVSTGSGIYMSLDSIIEDGDITVSFDRVLAETNRNGFTGIAFGIDAVDNGFLGKRLFIGQENRIITADESNKISIKKTFNKEIPSFFVDNEELPIGYIYNSFNNVLCFREPQAANKIISSAYLPRREWIAENGGWAFTNPSAEVFVYRNGIPTWLDWALSDDDIISNLEEVRSQLTGLPELNTFNSLQPDATNYLNKVLSDIFIISTVVDGDNGVNSQNIVNFMNDYSRFISLVSPSIRDREVNGERVKLQLPSILLAGIKREDREAGSKAALIEDMNDFESSDSSGLIFDVTTGSLDFLQAYSSATDPEVRDNLTFNKFELIEVSVFRSNVSNTGDYSHREIEDAMELVNSGLSSNMASSMYTNFIKAGIFLEGQHRNVFSTYNVSNIQSKYYAAWTNDWYDTSNSTVDYETIVSTSSRPASRFSTAIQIFDDPYFNERVWVGTDYGIIQYFVQSNGNVVLEKIIDPKNREGLYIWDICLFQGTVYVVAENRTERRTRLYKTFDFGETWSEEILINLPERFYTINVISGNLVCGSETGVFYSDNNFGQWYETGISNQTDGSYSSSKNKIRNVFQSTFLIIESEKYFYRTNSGLELFSVGNITNNGVNTVNDVARFKNITFVATDVGLYNDGNSILSDRISFSLEEIEQDLETSSEVQINSITQSQEALYVCGSNSKIYRYFDNGSGNEWASFTVPDFGSIHRIVFYETSNKQWIYAFSYDQMRIIDVTPGEGEFG